MAFVTLADTLVAEIAALGDVWSTFRVGVLEQRFRSAHVVPLQLRGAITGSASACAKQ